MRVSQYRPPSIIPRKRIIKPDPEELEEEEEDILEMSEPVLSTSSMQQPPVQSAAMNVEPSVPQEPEIQTSDEPEPAQPSLSNSIYQQPPVQEQQQQPTIANIPPSVPHVQNGAPQSVAPVLPSISSTSPAKKRVRVGLSKKTSTPLHQVNLPTASTSSYTPPTVVNRPATTSVLSSSPAFTAASNVVNMNAVNTEATSSNAPPASSSFASRPPPSNQEDNSNNGGPSTTKAFKSPFAEGK